MKRGTIGFGVGVVGGLIKLLIDQLAFAINVSSVNTSGTISQIFYGGRETLPLISWGIYLIITGLVGWIVSKIISRKYEKDFISSGIITGLILWAIMNVIFAVSGIETPTWSMGAGSLIVNLISHIVFGIIIIYAISRSKVEVTE